MNIRDSMHLAASALRGCSLRAFLTILSLAVGVAAVLTVLALGEAGEKKVEEEIVALGVNKVWIRPLSGSKLKETDVQRVRDAVGAPACAGTYTMSTASYKNQTALLQIAGYDSSAAAVHAPKVLEGRMFVPADFQISRHVCLIDEVLDQHLGGETLGEYIRVANRRMRVIGIIKPLTLQSLSGGNGMMILPLGFALDTFGGTIAEITIAVQPGQDTGTIAEMAENVLDEGQFRTDTLEKEVKAARQIVQIFINVLLCVAFVSILSGGIGVMNVMMIAVRERRNEIGLIKAIGGTDRQIAILFLLEAGAYAVMGSGLGFLIGHGLIAACGALIGLQAAAGFATVTFVLAGAVLIGIGFGVAPAIQAAGLQPIEALRSD